MKTRGFSHNFDAPALLEEAMGFTTYDPQNSSICRPTINPPASDATHALVAGALPVTDKVWSLQEAISDTPFTLSGAPVTAPPRSYPNQSTSYTPGPDDGTPPRPIVTQINLDTSGLIKDPILNSGTTLRTVSEPNVTFRLVFIAFHKGIWSDSTPQVSLFFSGNDSGKTVYTHICIPVKYTMDDVNTNLFLNSWLKGSAVSSGLTVNNLLDAKNGLKFQVMYYCLGGSAGWNSYNLFLSSEPLLLNLNGLPNWLQYDVAMSGSQWTSPSSYRLKTFSDFYTYAMNIRNPSYTQFLNWASLGTKDAGSKKIFTSIFDTTTQTAIKVSYYTLAPGLLSGTAFKKTAQRILPKKQIKCYPINLMKDIDSNGNVVVDSNNVPISTTDAKNDAQGATLDVKLDPAIIQSQNNTAVFIFAIIIGILAGIFVLAIVFYVFASRKEALVASMSSVASLPAPLPAPLPAVSLPAALPTTPLPSPTVTP